MRLRLQSLISLMLAMSEVVSSSSSGDDTDILVSGYNSKLTRIKIRSPDSAPVLEKIWSAKVDNDMSWLQVEDDIVYAAHEVESYRGATGGAVSRWRLTF